MINIKNFENIIKKKQVCMENIITNMIRHYKNCYFKHNESSIMLVRCLSKTDKPIHNFKGFYHFNLNDLSISSTVWNSHTKHFDYSVIKF